MRTRRGCGIFDPQSPRANTLQTIPVYEQQPLQSRCAPHTAAAGPGHTGEAPRASTLHDNPAHRIQSTAAAWHRKMPSGAVVRAGAARLCLQAALCAAAVLAAAASSPQACTERPPEMVVARVDDGSAPDYYTWKQCTLP